ncbi:MAG: gas vesicle protein [Acidobacteria bacterium]|nr:gas vesicle protein [Acidobacteriota bacterium]MCA1648804.1 gas vesicle protein [Acidobacteriota bacterium]
MKRPTGRTTIPSAKPPRAPKHPSPPRSAVPSYLPPRRTEPPPPRAQSASRAVARIIDQSDSSLLDVIDNLLNKGVVLNAEVVLALADVDLVYIRLSALLCAADRILPDIRRSR